MGSRVRPAAGGGVAAASAEDVRDAPATMVLLVFKKSLRFIVPRRMLRDFEAHWIQKPLYMRRMMACFQSGRGEDWATWLGGTRILHRSERAHIYLMNI